MKIVKLHIKLYTLSIGYILCTYLPPKPKKSKTEKKKTAYTSKEQKELVIAVHLYNTAQRGYNRKTEVSLSPI